MNILVINVSLRPMSPLKLFPIGLGYITTAMKNAGFDFDLLDIDAHRHSDQDVENIIRKKKYDVVCMGCIVTGYKIVKSLANLIKECHPNATIIVGNSVATSIIDTLLMCTKVDIAVMSEGDETIVDLLRTLSTSGHLEEVKGICFVKNDEIVRTSVRPPIKDISALSFIDFSLFDVETYIATSPFAVNDPLPIPRENVRALPINTARGCVANCNFCYHVFNGVPYRHRNPDSIVAEIKLLSEKYDLNYILFWDELTFFSKKQTLALVEKMLDEKLHIYWAANCRGNLFDKDEDVEIMIKMKEAGCLSVGYSLESAEPSILKAMNKKVSVEQFSRQTQLFRKAGMHAVTSLVLGYPQETPESIRKTFDCCIENKIYPSAGYLLPQPGSGMYLYAVEHGFISDEEKYLLKMGDRQDLRLNMTRMSDQEFEKYVFEGLKRCNEEMGIGLHDEELIKTLFYRSATSEESDGSIHGGV
jgi:anaerobic magnesium-protoporphyrin IX monomethyl ester cyclase